MALTVSDLATQLQATVQGDGSVVLSGIAQVHEAQAGQLTFAESEAFLQAALQSKASAVLVPKGVTAAGKVLIQVDNPRVALVKVLALLHPEEAFAPGVHPTAVVASSASVDASVHVGPLCVVGERTRIGAGAVLESGVQIGADCVLGTRVHLFPGVILYRRTQLGDRVRVHAGTVIGSDGFGYVFHKGAHVKIPQVGYVRVGDDVEIGANVAIDRGVFGATEIGRGTKIDNLVQVAHNVVVGEGCLLVGQAGISGSTRLGNFVTLAGQVGLAGHLKIGDRATVGAKSGVMHNIPEGENWLGIPATEHRQAKRQMIALQRLPQLIRRVAELERKLEGLDSAGSSG